MRYIYILSGITVWVIIVSASSGLLISNENTKSMVDTIKKVDQLSQNLIISKTTVNKNLEKSVPAVIENTKAQNTETVVNNPTVIKQPETPTVRRYEEEGDDD